jgi:hypothetical protein
MMSREEAIGSGGNSLALTISILIARASVGVICVMSRRRFPAAEGSCSLAISSPFFFLVSATRGIGRWNQSWESNPMGSPSSSRLAALKE